MCTDFDIQWVLDIRKLARMTAVISRMFLKVIWSCNPPESQFLEIKTKFSLNLHWTYTVGCLNSCFWVPELVLLGNSTCTFGVCTYTFGESRDAGCQQGGGGAGNGGVPTTLAIRRDLVPSCPGSKYPLGESLTSIMFLPWIPWAAISRVMTIVLIFPTSSFQNVFFPKW